MTTAPTPTDRRTGETTHRLAPRRDRRADRLRRDAAVRARRAGVRASQMAVDARKLAELAGVPRRRSRPRSTRSPRCSRRGTAGGTSTHPARLPELDPGRTSPTSQHEARAAFFPVYPWLARAARRRPARRRHPRRHHRQLRPRRRRGACWSACSPGSCTAYASRPGRWCCSRCSPAASCCRSRTPRRR